MNTDDVEKKTATDMTAIRDVAEQSIEVLFAARTVYEAGTAAEVFLEHLAAAPKYRRWLCERFTDRMIDYCAGYVTLPFGSVHNVTVVPPEHSAVLMLPTYIPI
jgi:hypothetical protein